MEVFLSCGILFRRLARPERARDSDQGCPLLVVVQWVATTPTSPGRWRRCQNHLLDSGGSHSQGEAARPRHMAPAPQLTRARSPRNGARALVEAAVRRHQVAHCLGLEHQCKTSLAPDSAVAPFGSRSVALGERRWPPTAPHLCIWGGWPRCARGDDHEILLPTSSTFRELQ